MPSIGSKRRYSSNDGPSKKYKSTRRGRVLSRMSSNSVSRFQATARTELKNWDTATTNYNPAQDVFAITTVNPIPAGTGVNQMVGRLATLKSIMYHYSIITSPFQGTLTTVFATVVRLMVVYDKAPVGVVPLITDILTSNQVEAPMNLTNANRFIVLFDDQECMGAAGVNAGGTASIALGGPMTATKKQYKKINLPYRGPSTAGLTAIEEGAIYFFAISNQPNGTDHNTVSTYFRVRFEDA